MGGGSPKFRVAGVEFGKGLSGSRKAVLAEDLVQTWDLGGVIRRGGVQVEAWKLRCPGGMVWWGWSRWSVVGTEWWPQAEGLCLEDLLTTRVGEGRGAEEGEKAGCLLLCVRVGGRPAAWVAHLQR